MITKIKSKIYSTKKDKHFLEILRGSIWSFGAKILAVLLGLLLNLMITRIYGAESMGAFALINSFFAIVMILSLMGTNTAVLRLIPEYISKFSFESAVHVYWKMVLIVAILSILLMGIIYFNIEFITKSIFHHIEMIHLFSIAALLIIFPALSMLNLSAFRAFKSIKFFSVFQFFDPLSKLMILGLLTLVSIHQYNPVYAIFYTNVLLAILSFIAIGYILKNRPVSLPGTQIESISYLSILTLSFPMFLTSAMYVVILQTDIIMLGMMSSVKTVGVYAIAVKLSMLTSFILSTVNTMAAPKFSELFHSGQLDKLQSVTQKSSKLMFWSTLPIVFVLVFFGELILGLFGEDFVIGYLALLILVIGQFINATVGSVGYFLNMTGYQKILNIIIMVAAMINIILNYFLIPVYGLNGAAFATALSLALWNLLAAVYIKTKFGYFIGYFPQFKFNKKVKK